MKHDVRYSSLADYICAKNFNSVNNLLSKYSDLDIFYKDGRFFNFAIESDSTDIMQALICYFEHHQLQNYIPQSIEYLLLKDKLRNVLKVAIEDVELSQEIKEILSPYIDFENSERDSDFLEDKTHIDNNFILEEQVKSTAIKKSYSMDDLHNSTFENSQANSSTESHHSDLVGNLHNNEEF